jgi:hypothetical protein
MKQLTFAVLLICLSVNAAYAGGGNDDKHQPAHPVHPAHPAHPLHPVHPLHPTHPTPALPQHNNLNTNANANAQANSNANATGIGIGVGGAATATGVNGNISPTQKTTVSTGSQTNRLNGKVEGTFLNDGRQSVDVNSTNHTGDMNAHIKGGNSAASQSQNQNQSATGSGNVTEINYDAPRIPVSTAATVLLPPVVCASSASGLGVQTQVFGFNFGNANSRERCWQSKEATECVNLAVATSSLFGMRRMMAQVAVGCTVQSPSFRDFAKEMGKAPVDFAKEIIASYGEEQKVVRDQEYSRIEEQLAAEQTARRKAEEDRDALVRAKEALVVAPAPVKAPVKKARVKRAVVKKDCDCKETPKK